MGVKVREKVKDSGVWWIFANFRGKRKAYKIGTDKEHAEAKAKELEGELSSKNMPLRTKGEVPTLRQFAEKWIKGHCKQNLKPATVTSYRANLDDAILPEFGAYPIDQIPRDEVKAFAYRLLERRHHKTEENPQWVPYSKASVHSVIRTLSAVMGHAVEDGLVKSNPAAKPGKFIKMPKGDQDLPTPEEGEVLFASTLEHSPADYPLIFTLYRSGMRKGEIRGLQWEDIDWNGRFIEVRRAFSKKVMGTPKSGKSRKVEMGDRMFRVLKAHQTAEKARARKGSGTGTVELLKPLQAPEWVFPAADGGPLPDDAINTIHDRALRKANMRLTRVHDARHCFASWNLSRGASLFWVSRQMGHSSVKITADLYGKYIPSEDRTAANLLDTAENCNPGATTKMQVQVTSSNP